MYKDLDNYKQLFKLTIFLKGLGLKAEHNSNGIDVMIRIHNKLSLIEASLFNIYNNLDSTSED